MRKIIKCLCALSVAIVVVYVSIGMWGGFHLKGIGCKGGFYTGLWQDETENIKAICGETLTEDELWQIKSNLSIDRDNHRIINTKYINENSEEIKLQCKIKWYWSDNYIWSKIA